MSTVELSVIIVSFNTQSLTVQAVESVYQNLAEDQLSGEVIVVDNASTDNSVRELTKKFKDLIIIENSHNAGFARANNQGIKKSKGNYLLLLNSDTVLYPHALKHLLDCFTSQPENPHTAHLEHTRLSDRVGIVSGQLRNKDKSIQVQGGALPTLLNIAAWWLWPLPGNVPIGSAAYHQEDPDFFTKEQLIGWVGGTAMCIKRAVIDEVGYLDEGIFMYAEDVEYCLRAHKHHWDVTITPNAKITHYGSASGSAQKALIGEVKGLLYLWSKHYSTLEESILKGILKAGAFLRYLLFGILLRNESKKSTYKAIWQEVRVI